MRASFIVIIIHINSAFLNDKDVSKRLIIHVRINSFDPILQLARWFTRFIVLHDKWTTTTAVQALDYLGAVRLGEIFVKLWARSQQTGITADWVAGVKDSCSTSRSIMDAIDRSVSHLLFESINIGISRDLDTSGLPELVIQPVSISQVIKIEVFSWAICWSKGWTTCRS